MAKRDALRMWVVGAAVGLMATLFIVPTTRGMLEAQLEMVGFAKNPVSNPTPVTEIAASHPADFQIQLAAVRSTVQASGDVTSQNFNPDVALRPLLILEEKYPTNPSTYANILRWLTFHPICSWRPENELLQGKRPDSKQHEHVSTAYYTFFDRVAEKGEQLDPDNGYFPFMRAAGLFGQSQDTEALAEIHKAASAPTWREYTNDEVHGSWKISDLQFGTKSALGRAATAAAILFPHYSQLRSAARIATYIAMTDEKAGNYEAALEIREDLIRCGALMRGQSNYMIGSLVGIAIGNVGKMRLDGKLVMTGVRTSSDSDEGGEQRVKDFCVYLASHGHGEVAPAVYKEYQNGLAFKYMISAANVGTYELQKFYKSFVLWSADLILLAAAAILAMSGILASSALSWRRLLDFKLAIRVPAVIAALSAAAFIAVAASANLIASEAFPGLKPGDEPGSYSITSQDVATVETLICLVGVIATVVVSAVFMIRSSERGLHRVYMPLLSAVVSCGAVFLVVQFAYFEILRCYSVAVSGEQQSSIMLLGVSCGVLGLPILVVIVSAIVSICKRRPVWRGVLAGLGEWTLPLAGLVMLLYGCSFMMTITSDKKLNQMVQQVLSGESNYFAQATGQTLPGPLIWPGKPGPGTDRHKSPTGLL